MALALFAAISRSAPYLSQRNSDSGAFPDGAHDDQVDAMTQALRRWNLVPSQTIFVTRRRTKSA